MVGMRQLDNNQDLSADFDKDLERELNRLSSRAKNKLRVKISAFSISLTAFLVVGSFLYAGAIAKIYNFEQNTKKSNQGKYYFSTSLGNQLLVNGIDHMKVSEEIENEKKITGFERIKGFKQLEEDLDKILDTGEELLYDEVIID